MNRPTSLSLGRKLPLLISVLLSALAVGLTWAGYVEVRRASELRAIDRLQRLAAEFAQLAGPSMEQRMSAMRDVAADSAVIAHLATPDAAATSAAATAALRRLAVTAADTPIVAELRSAAESRLVATRPETAGDEEPITTLVRSLASARKPVTGDLYARHDSVFYWVGAPVTGQGRVLGYLLQRRTVGANARVEQTIRRLVGTDSVTVYFASDSGSVWTTLTGHPMAPPTVARNPRDTSNVVRYTHGTDRRYVGVYARIPNTPLRAISEMPYDAMMDRPTAFLRRNAVVAVVMLIVGMFAAWLLSRHITRPLRDLTEAADAISVGDYSRRAAVERRDETGRLADAFNTMAEQVQRSHEDLARQNEASLMLAARLEEANRAKADFLATMSHELRTPLNAIGGYVDLMQLGIRGPVTDDQRRDLDRVRYNQRHLLTLIGNILDFARIEARKLPFDIGDVRLDEAALDVLGAVAPLLDEKGLTRECAGCDAPVVVRADRARVEQILLNLLSNAVRFTPPTGRVTVSIETGTDVAALTVADDGMGIPPEKLSAIFEPFVQLDSSLTRQVGGTGLGLTISRDLARAMGGDLVAESAGSGGARFRLTLPLVPVRVERAAGTLAMAGD